MSEPATDSDSHPIDVSDAGDDWESFQCSKALFHWQQVPRASASDAWPAERGFSQMVYHKGFVYLHGGQTTTDEDNVSVQFSDLWRFDLRQRKWERLAPTNVDRMAHTMHVVEFHRKKYLLVFGGYNPSGIKPELFDLDAQEWVTKNNQYLPICEKRRTTTIALTSEGDPQRSLETTTSLDRISHGYETVNVVQHFLVEDKTDRYLHSSVCVKHVTKTTHTMYVFGGIEVSEGCPIAGVVALELDDDHIEMDLADQLFECDLARKCDQHTSLSGTHIDVRKLECSGEAPHARYGHQACALGTEAMLVYGGFDADCVRLDFFLVHRLDLNTLHWTAIDVQELPPQRMLFSMIVDSTNSRIVAVGGSEPSLSDEDDAVADRSLDTFVAHITADTELDTDTQELTIKYSMTWRRVTKNVGCFPKTFSAPACCSIFCGDDDGAAFMSLHENTASCDESLGIACLFFGGQSNVDNSHTSMLTTLRVSSRELEDDFDVVCSGSSSCSEEDISGSPVTRPATVPDLQFAEDACASAESPASSCEAVHGEALPQTCRKHQRDTDIVSAAAPVLYHSSSPSFVTSSSASQDACVYRSGVEDNLCASRTGDASINTAVGSSSRVALIPFSLGNTETGTVRSLGSTASQVHPFGMPEFQRSNSDRLNEERLTDGLLRALVESVQDMGQRMTSGFDSLRRALAETNTRIDGTVARLDDLHQRVVIEGAVSAEQRLVNAQVKETLARIEKELRLR